jgi:hypothetical protein
MNSFNRRVAAIHCCLLLAAACSHLSDGSRAVAAVGAMEALLWLVYLGSWQRWNGDE